MEDIKTTAGTKMVVMKKPITLVELYQDIKVGHCICGLAMSYELRLDISFNVREGLKINFTLLLTCGVTMNSSIEQVFACFGNRSHNINNLTKKVTSLSNLLQISTRRYFYLSMRSARTKLAVIRLMFSSLEKFFPEN